MESSLLVESLPLLGTCSLCLSEGVVKSMLLSYQNGNATESYTEMLLKCFCIDMAIIDLDDTKRLICHTCIGQLQDSLKFKEQVETSLKTLEATVRLKKADQQALDVKEESSGLDNSIHIIDDIDSDQVLQQVKRELTSQDIGNDSDDENILFGSVKQESLDGSDFDDHMELLPDQNAATHCEDPAEETQRAALNDLILKKERKEYRTRRRKKLNSNSKKVSYIVKKKIDLQDTEKMLESGLFPFKISKNQTYSCTICPEKSTSLDDIKTHIQDHTISNIHLAFKKMSSSSLQRFYKSSTKLRCKTCDAEISDYEALKNHIEICIRLNRGAWNTLPFKLEKDQLDCPICKKTFLNFVSLNTHMNVHFPNHICDSCGKAFASKARLRGHMRTHEVGDFPCRYCDAIFDKVTKRENHVSKEHKSGIRYACKRCNISLSSFYARQKHLAEVHNEELKRYKCKACPQSYITPGHLSSHVRRDHLNERNHKCNKCDLAFYTRNSLKMHMIRHDGERIHTCNICQKSYQRKKTLREHMRIHNNDKRFICPVCGRAFTQKCTLKGHLKVHERKVDLDDRIPPPLHSI